MNATTNRCNLCGCIGGHQTGCANRQGSGFTQSVYSYGSKPVEGKKVLRDLLEAAEDMYEYVEPTWNQAAKTWVKAAIEAARKEVGS